MLPGNQTPTTSLKQLFFCYNRQQNDILYTNVSFDIFFGSTAGKESGLPLFQHPGWQRSLQLVQEEEHHFSFEGINDNVHYTCNVKAIETTAGSGSLELLMCTVNRSEGTDTMTSDPAEDFIHLAAHDLDAPLRKISVLIERLMSKIKPGSEGAEFIPRIEANVKDMRAMIDGLTTFSKAYHTSLPASIDLAKLINEVVTAIRKDYHPREIFLEMDVMPVVNADVGAYRELFYHLIKNAVVFSKNGPVFISISAAEASEDEKARLQLQNGIKFYKITVRDKGIGFRQEDADKIFLPFTRLHGKSAYPGSGLGLAICKRIVENHYGAICGEGMEDEGARFILFLPQSLN